VYLTKLKIITSMTFCIIICCRMQDFNLEGVPIDRKFQSLNEGSFKSNDAPLISTADDSKGFYLVIFRNIILLNNEQTSNLDEICF